MHGLCDVKPTYGQHTELHVNPKAKHARLKSLLGWMDNSGVKEMTHILLHILQISLGQNY
jgi:hypothetical protein